jgi:hypothetical protein
MPDLTTKPDVRLLVRWLGTDGAKAGLAQSKVWTVDLLREAAAQLSVKVPEKSSRQQLIDEIVRVASKRIDKKLDDLFAMSHDDLIRYFEERQVERAEILDLLKEMNLAPGREGNRNVLEFAAREISETGRFMRIASK